jgi:hypothetical protein
MKPLVDAATRYKVAPAIDSRDLISPAAFH